MNIIFKPECKTEIIEPTYDLPIIGEPISKTGASANNSNAYGVIVGIIGDGSSRRVRVMTEGYIDYDKVKENYMEYTDEAINALTGITLCSGGKLPTGVQSDWNQNDVSAPDYVKNRPFYTGDPVETVLVEESTVSFADTGGLYMAQFPSTFSATVGETYKVYWDGAAYECACVDYNGYIAVGNLSIAGAGSDTGEPFLMLVNNGSGIKFYTADTSASHTISISGSIAENVQIPDKYISVTFRDVIIAGDPLDWSTADWTKYYGLFQGGKLLKINSYKGSTFEAYALSMFYTAGVGSYISVITSTGDFYKLSLNNTTSELYWLPIFELSKLYLKYLQTGSDPELSNREEYMRLEVTNNELTFTTKTSPENRVERKVVLEADKELILSSSTTSSTKKFKITVDDSGALTATEVTE